MKGLRWLGVPVLLGFLLLQMALSSVRKSAAFDETYHLVAGYAYLTTGDPRLSWEHPPLAQVLAALPLLAREDMAPIPLDHPAWRSGNAEGFADAFLWEANGAIAPDLVWTARWPLMGLTALFGLAVFLAVRWAFGEPAAWLALILFVLDPNVVGNGRTVTNDLPLAGLMFLAVWRLGAYLRRPSLLRLVVAGVATGLALGTKLSALLLGPIFLLIAAVYRPSDSPPIRWTHRLLALLATGVLAALVLWAIFGFEVGPVADGGPSLPAPTYLRGIPGMAQRVARSTPTFLLGRVSETGLWYYFLIVFLLKTPPPLLLLLIPGSLRALRRPRETVLWWGSAFFYFAVASASPLQIGYRYILPFLFFCFPLAAAGLDRWPRPRWQQAAIAGLMAWALVEAVFAFPDHLSYVNLLGGGTDNGWRIFADQNVDWGQDLPALRDYVEAHSITNLRLAYFGSAYPQAYGVKARLLPGFSRLLSGPERFGYNPYSPPPGTYAISVTSLNLGLIYERQDLYAFFRGREPEAMVGHSILVYRIDYPRRTPVQRAVVVGPDVASVSPERLGWTPGHRLIAKWAGPGAFILAARPARYVIEAPVPDSPLVEAVRTAHGGAVALETLSATIPRWATPTTPDGSRVPLPALFADGPFLVGWDLSAPTVRAGDSFMVTTYWRIEGRLEPPLAIFVHLLGPEGFPIAQWDGWPVATDGLERGDLVILSHPITVPEGAPPGEWILQVGLYRPPSGPRLSVAGGDRLILATIVVRNP